MKKYMAYRKTQLSKNPPRHLKKRKFGRSSRIDEPPKELYIIEEESESSSSS
jgi:hypothetical protein